MGKDIFSLLKHSLSKEDTKVDNLWLLTEERPKASVIIQIINMYCTDFNDSITLCDNVKIRPCIKNGIFQFIYQVEGLTVKNAASIFIKTVSGSSSFLDFLLFKQTNAPAEGSTSDNLLMAIEETKTNDDESRNTGVYQRGSKFVYISPYYPNAKLYMLYNEELGARENKRPSDTSIFGTNILLTLGVTIIGKNIAKWFKPFQSLEELISFKANMKQPPAGNIPITITKYNNYIEISGRLSKPANAGNIGHDPNIGALSMISKCIRALGWDKEIIITMHGVSQSYINKTHGKNKFLYICNILNIKLKDIQMPASVSLPESYWHYEMSSEKMTSILLHVLALYYGLHGVYENHAGCERGYFRTKNNTLITLPKKDLYGENLYLPDVVLYDNKTNYIILVEGKKLSTLQNGIEEIQYYGSIEKEYIEKYYPGATILRCVSIFGGNKTNYLHKDVLIYMNLSGKIFINPYAPECIKTIFRKEGIVI